MGCWRSQNSIEDSSTTAGPILDLIAGGCWARRQLRSGIKDVSVTSELRKSLTLVGVVFIGTLAIPELDGRFLHGRWTNPESDCGRLLGSTPATQRYRIHPSAIFIHDVTGLNGMGCWRSQNSMADSSTTTSPILDLIAGDRWARRQLRSGIKDVSVASELRKSLTLVGVVFIGTTWRYQNSMADYSTTTAPILDLIVGYWWARRQLHRGIRYVLRRLGQFPMELSGVAWAEEAGLRLECEFSCLLEQ